MSNYTAETFPHNNWYMQFTEEERPVVDNWRINIIKYSTTPCPGNYINWEGRVEGRPGRRLILFSDFKKFVLKEQEVINQDYKYLTSILNKYNIT